jgi:hypothetical protein
MKNLAYLASALVALTAAPAFADSSYQTLMNAYQSSTSPASMSDFINQPLKTCVAVSQATPNENETTQVMVKCGKVLTPASPAKDIPAVAAYDVPADGPLLPAHHVDAVPAEHIPATAEVCDANDNLLLMIATVDEETALTADELAVFSNAQTNTDFVIGVAKNSQGVYSDIGDNVQILIRKQGSVFPFVVKSDAGIVFNGYCY